MSREEFAKLFTKIGTGIALPFTFASKGETKTTSTEEGIEKLNNSIKIILDTYFIERFNVPEFGSELRSIVFDPLDEPTLDLIQLYTVEALRRWEKRIEIQSFNFILDEDNNAIAMRINYIVVGAQVEASFVYPFKTSGQPTAGLTSGTLHEVIFGEEG